METFDHSRQRIAERLAQERQSRRRRRLTQFAIAGTLLPSLIGTMALPADSVGNWLASFVLVLGLGGLVVAALLHILNGESE